ncbi:hypothetical protein D3C78_1808880 [compost metagenome]
MLQAGVKKLQRERSHQNWLNSKARQAHQERQMPLSDDFEFARQCAKWFCDIREANPEMPPREIKALAERQVRELWARAG